VAVDLGAEGLVLAEACGVLRPVRSCLRGIGDGINERKDVVSK
jgi:hypothetical protein